MDTSNIPNTMSTSEEKTPATFSACLGIEKDGQALADQLYQQLYPERTIFRPDYHKKGYEQDLQKNDVDVVLRGTLPDGWPHEHMISEKFRSQLYYDEMIELYEDYENQKTGWALNCIAHEYYMFHKHPKNEFDPYVIIVPKWAVKKLARMASEQFNYFMSQMSDKRWVKVKFMGEPTVMIAMPTYGGPNRILWTNRCIAIPHTYFKYINAPIKRYNYIKGAWVHDEKFYKEYNICN